jgi:phosphomannomutase/phosphoglucomutase
MSVFGSSGARGVANEDLSPEFVMRVARAAGTDWGTDRAAVARDTRATGAMLASAAAAGLASVGVEAERVGVVPTPGAQAYAEQEGVPAVMITASHNPPEYNGVKLVGADGVELSRDALDDVEALLGEEVPAAPWDAVGDVRQVEGARRRYREALLASVDRERVADAGLTVALDPGHGAGALTSPAFFRELGCEVVSVHAQPDGHFPGRDPEPVRENLGDLRALVRAGDADVGVAHDGDADRAIFVDERGEYVEGDAALAALAAAELEAGDAAVSAVNVSQRLVDVCEDVGADLELTPIGSTHLISRVEELRAAGRRVPVAGEGNGGIFFPGYRVARDGAYTAARFLELVAERPVTDLVAPYDGYHNVRVNIEYDADAERVAMLDAAEARAEEAGADLSTIDGYRLDYGDAWVLARPSGTEPVVRVYAEAREEARAADLAEGMERALLDARDRV